MSEEKKTRTLKCIVTGRLLTVTKEYYTSKVEKAGSEAALHSTYICKEAKTFLKGGYTVSQIREMLSIDDPSLGEVSTDIIQDIIRNSKSTNNLRIKPDTIQNNIALETDIEVKKFINILKNV